MPALAPEALRECYRTMLRLRALDERRARARGRRRGGRVARDARLRGGIVGAVSALRGRTTWWFPGGARPGAALWRGHTVAALAAGRPMPRALGVLPGSPYRATQLPHATGIAWAMKLQAKEKGQGKPAGQGGAGVPRSGVDQRRRLSRRLELRGRVPRAGGVRLHQRRARPRQPPSRPSPRRSRSRRSPTGWPACASTATTCSRCTRRRRRRSRAPARAAARR